MPEYRFFVVAQNGHIHEPPLGVEAANDAEALKLARGQLRENDIEVWLGARLVAYLTPEQFCPCRERGLSRISRGRRKAVMPAKAGIQ